MAAKREVIEVAGREVTITNPDKVFFPKTGITKKNLVLYYLAVAEGALRGVARRPMILKRYPDGVEHDPFFQKRAPEKRPEWIETVVLTFPSGRSAEEIVVSDAAQLAWIINLGCVDLNPHPVRASDLEHPDELRVDLDPVPGIEWPQIVEVARVAREVLTDVGLVGFPKTSGSRGIHVYARIAPKWSFDEVRSAALALAREVERRAPKIATSRWWKEERHGVFLDYNQNAKDRTVASAYSVRPLSDARVSMPLSWDDLYACDPADFTIVTAAERFADKGDAHRSIDDVHGSLEPLLALAAAQAASGMKDAPWPPHFAAKKGEARRVAPSRRAKAPLVVVAKAAKKDDALEGLERWKARHPDAARHLLPEDVLVDAMRGRFTTWTRIRVNLKNVPDAERPPSEAPDPDYEPTW